jgi:hypothetical protein
MYVGVGTWASVSTVTVIHYPTMPGPLCLTPYPLYLIPRPYTLSRIPVRLIPYHLHHLVPYTLLIPVTYCLFLKPYLQWRTWGGLIPLRGQHLWAHTSTSRSQRSWGVYKRRAAFHKRGGVFSINRVTDTTQFGAYYPTLRTHITVRISATVCIN